MLLNQQQALDSVQPVASTSAVPYHSQSASVDSDSSSAQSPPRAVIINGQVRVVEKSGGRLKKFICPHEDCGKAYTRPVRLEEHIRSHTGERPFKCPTCESTFLRESHLKAHARTHLTDEDKSLACDECDKKFWTSQHLRKHVQVVHRGKTYDCADCGASFRKHNLLRAHIAEEHSPPGTNPFRCEHPGCGKSFKQKVHLKSHAKVHDPSRYLCAHPDCLDLPLEARQFENWSALGKHTKIAHPPTCPHSICNGRTFASSRGLKGHLQLHADGAEEAVLLGKKRRAGPRKKDADVQHKSEVSESEKRAPDNEADGGSDEEDSEWEERQDDERDERMQADFSRGGKKKRRIMARIDTDSPWICDHCTRRFKSNAALDSHITSAHATQNAAESQSLPSSVVPKRADSTDASGRSRPGATTAPSLLDLLTGASYRPDDKGKTAEKDARTRQHRCPYPSILDIAFPLLPSTEHESEACMPVHSAAQRDAPCTFWFSRVYDVERHLRGHHRLKVTRAELEEWLSQRVA